MAARSTSLVWVPDNLESVTTVGHEDALDPDLDPEAVAGLWRGVLEWFRLGSTPAIQVCVRRGGRMVLNRAIGYGWGNEPGAHPDAPKVLVSPDTPFCGFSTAKGVSATLMMMLVERGAFALSDPVCRYVPEFAAHGKRDITIGDVLTHSAGVPFIPRPYKGADLVVDEELAVRALADLKPSWPRHRFRAYHALTSGLIVRLLVRRATGKRMRELLSEHVLQPLRFRWTNFGVRPTEVPRVVPSVKTGPDPSRISVLLARKALGGSLGEQASEQATRAFLTAELPSGNLVTTAFELARFYDMLARGGELDGIRIIGTDTLRQAVRPAPWLPGVAGRVSVAGFELGGRRSKFGRDTMAHFGRSGFTTQYGWADPARALAGAILTSGKSTLDGNRPWQLCARIAAVIPRVQT